MAGAQKESAYLVNHYLETRRPDMAEIHEAWAVESTFNELKSKYEMKEKHE
jgi:hypothetical protein